MRHKFGKCRVCRTEYPVDKFRVVKSHRNGPRTLLCNECYDRSPDDLTKYKRCPKCKEIQPKSHFSPRVRNGNNRGELEGYCKKCDKSKQLQICYGITIWGYLGLYLQQKGRCAICDLPGKVFSGLHVDHSHSAENVRGLLCQPCNLALGNMRDSQEVLQKAINYLTDHANIDIGGSPQRVALHQ